MSQPLISPSFLHTLDQLTLVSRRLRAGTFKGERRSPRRGGSVEFADYREYAPGDDFRQIDWNAYARLERLLVRLFVEEEDATVHILIDASESMNFGQPSKWDYARRVAAALGYIALVGMDRLSGAAMVRSGERPCTLFPPHRGKSQALAWFNWLTALEPGGAAWPTSALRHYAASVKRVGPLILIGDLMDDGWREGIQTLAASGYEITLLHLLAPQELAPELEGDLKLLDSETRAAIEITADFDLLSRYGARVHDWQNEWAEFSAVRAINYAPIETARPFEELILSFLRRREIIK